MGKAGSSRDLNNLGQPMAAMLDHIHVAQKIEQGCHDAASLLH